MSRPLLALLSRELDKLRQAGLENPQRPRGADPAGDRPRATEIDLTGHDTLCLARDPRVRDAAMAMLSRQEERCVPRMLGGTLPVHHDLEQRLAGFVGAQAAALHGSAYLAGVGLFQAIFDHRDAIFCDALIHPGLADGVRLCRARAFTYRNNDVGDLEDKLKRSRAARFRAVVTDAVFPFDGRVANLGEICALSDRYDAVVVVDDSLGIGVLGPRGRGACELHGVSDRVDLVVGSFTKVLGGMTGGFVAGARELVEWVRQKSTSYFFSSPPSPAMAAGALAALQLIEQGEVSFGAPLERATALRRTLSDKGFSVLPGEYPIVSVVVGHVVTLQRMVNLLQERGVRVHGLCYPVVPEREARVRIKVTARHSEAQLRRAAEALDAAAREVGVLSA